MPLICNFRSRHLAFLNSVVHYSSVRWLPLCSGPTWRPPQNSPPKLLHSAAPLISPFSRCGAVSSLPAEVLQFQCNHIIAFIAFPQVERVESRRFASSSPPRRRSRRFQVLVTCPAGLWAALLSPLFSNAPPHTTFHTCSRRLRHSRALAHCANIALTLTLTLTFDCSLHRRSFIEFSPLLAADLSLTRTMCSSRGNGDNLRNPSSSWEHLEFFPVRSFAGTDSSFADSRGRSTSPLACCSFSHYCFLVFIFSTRTCTRTRTLQLPPLALL